MQTVSTAKFKDGDWTESTPAQTDSDQTLIFVFGDSGQIDQPQPLRALRQRYPLATIVGASGAGTVCGLDVLDGALTATLIRFEHTSLNSVALEVLDSASSRQAGRHLATSLNRRPGLSSVYILADGLCVNGPELVLGLTDELPTGVGIAGGMAGDGVAFERTWTLVDGLPQQRHVTAVGFYGTRLQMHRGCRGGSIGFGPRRMVTRSKGNVVYTLDGEPVLKLYKEFLGEFANQLPGGASHFPLSVFRHPDSDDAVIRFVLGIDEAEQSITLAGDIPEGSLVQLSRANRDDLLQGSMMAAADVAAQASSQSPVVNLVVSCIGRRLVLGEQTDEELEAALETLPLGSHQTGFYSYGEISSVEEHRCDMHNMTLTLTTLCES
jgi:hypothetical protein